MKYHFLIFIFFVLKVSFSQERFNVILEDTVSHISNGTVVHGNNYYVLSEYTNEESDVVMCISKINEIGEIQWQKSYENDSMIIRSGWAGSLKENSDGYYICGTAISRNANLRGIHKSHFDSNFELIEQEIYLYDTDWKSCFNSVSDVNGDTYVCGQYLDTIENVGQLYVAKITEQDSLKWLHLTNTAYSYASKLLKHSNGNIYAGGAINYSGISDWYLVGYNTLGNYIWEENYGYTGSRSDGSVKALLETPDSCILACGSYPGIKVFEDTYYDGCIRKIDQEGELLWEQFYRTYTIYTNSGKIMSGLNFNHILSDQLGNYYAIGSTYAKNPLWRGFLMKLNENGKILFRRLYYSINEESNAIYLNSGSFTTDNGFILLGYGNAYDWFDIYPPQQRWLIKTDSMGMDGLCNTEPDALEVDIDFPDYLCANDTAEVYVYIAGPTAPYKLNISNGQTFDSIYYPPVFVPNEIGPGTIYVPYNLTTDLEFEEPEVTIANHEWGECIAIPIEYHVGNQLGYETLDITVTDGWGNSKTISKNIFVKTCPNGISSAELENSLQIYPNPASDFLTVDLEGNMQDFPISIVDMSGKVVLQSQLMDEYTSIDIRTLPAGNYQLMIEGVSKSFSVVR